ncbi:MAG: hypothetical protein A3C90_04325 [Candidatus Magasanikbacteria bacterium RIFCSPHIGHO2_02_FULL_51_14]|uniref:Penicillin-binding protein transpeptidase domain-containing protein n=1 Tax=Candidatus Magasanikbacteria bacterium RIFCSPHIGHO2_02_FULL_51_14 TaxID=1798683 RepID=A0A1F6MHL1_9BACT|nr:MAG: hypothetical protein A3C90_04325 [Candidatus Magasanikbacteria bacterium RIFCSPHIGHO2_02_FULL_51_14]
MYRYRAKNNARLRVERPDARLRAAAIAVTCFAVLVVARLFILMILERDFYTALAAGSHDVYAQLFPSRGEVFMQDSRSKEEYPLAINRDYFLVYADTREIMDDETAEDVAEQLSAVFSYDDEKKFALFGRLNTRDDPYEPIETKVDQDAADRLKALKLPGVYFLRKARRFYPEESVAAHVIGFVGKTEDGKDVGRYGVEGYWEKELAGKGGFFEGAKSAAGFWIPLAGRSFEPAEDGADLLLTIDRTLQFTACERLRQAKEEFGAASAALVIMDPKTGAIHAMCGMPDFNPNTYNQVDSIETYNNAAIFIAYEPGSVFKPVAMAAALNEEAVTPETTFEDTGSRDGICSKAIRNADQKKYGVQSMIGVLENSINTGMVFVAEQLGKEKFREYVERFGFGVKEGIALDSESSGTISSLSENEGDRVDCYAATASFGQGITATPLQLAAAYSAIANGGTLVTPRIVEEIRSADGRRERVRPVEVRKVLEKKTAAELTGMLINVVEKGHAQRAKIDGYYIAGKTGTAQIPGPGGYTEETNHTFAGFAPADDPRFVMVVKFEKPARKFAESTAVPVFGDIARFALQYYGIAPGR